MLGRVGFGVEDVHFKRRDFDVGLEKRVLENDRRRERNEVVAADAFIGDGNQLFIHLGLFLVVAGGLDRGSSPAPGPIPGC